MTDDDSGLFDDSRRSFMKKGAAATTALALGASATAGTVSAQEDDGGVVLVYGDDYQPGTNFDVISELNTQTKEDLIEDSGAEEDVFDDPDDWDAYIISYETGNDAPDWGFLLTEEVDLSAGDSDTMGEDGEFREPAVDLIEATPGETANGGDGGDGGNGDGMDGGDENGATADGGDGGNGGNQTGAGGGN